MNLPRLMTTLVVAVLLPAVATIANAQTPSFMGLGQMPGVMPGAGTFAVSVSADRSTIVGWAWVCPDGETTCTSSGKTEAFRWTATGKYQLLGDLGSSIGSMASSASANGAVIVGQAPPGTASFGGFRWTAAQGMFAIPPPMQYANAVTADGKMLVGGDYWWNTSGQNGKFGPFPGNTDQTQAYGVTGTSAAPVAVGAALKGSGPFGATFHAFRWTPAGGLQDLGLTIGDESIALAISADGTVVVGEARDASGFWRAFRWTAATGMQDLGTLGGPESVAYGVSQDGSVIVGTSLTSGSTGSDDAFRWTAATGMQDLRSILQAAGVHSADNWNTLDTASGVSADGTVIVGYGLNPPTARNRFGLWTPFRAVLPVP